MRRSFGIPVSFIEYVIENVWTDAPIEMKVKTVADSILQKISIRTKQSSERNMKWNICFANANAHTHTHNRTTDRTALDLYTSKMMLDVI